MSSAASEQTGLEKTNPPDAAAIEGLDAAESVPLPVAKQPSTGWRALLYPPQFVVAAILLGVLLVFSQGIKFREKVPPSRPFSEFPLDVDSWRGVRQIMEKRFILELDFSDYIMADYRDPQDKAVNFYVAYYESQRKGESIHSPASCLPGGGWEFRQSGTVAIPSGSGETITVNRVIMQLGNARQVAYYWFPKANRVLTNAYQLKIYTFWDALTRQRTDGALVRLITAVYRGEDLPAAEARLQDFGRRILPVLDDYLPD